MAIGLDSTALAALCQDPRTPVEGRLNGTTYTARIAIPDYGAHIERHYDRHTFTPPHGRFLLRR